MERIKQALERARRERQAAPMPSQGSVPRRARPNGSAAPEQTAPPAEIVYSQTRTLDIDASLFERNRIISGLEADPVSDAYRVLRTQVLKRMRPNNWTTLAVTSAGPGEGKTLTAINLAISFARDVNHTVLLCDLDLKRPRVHQYFGLQGAKGLSDYLLGDTALPDLLFNPGIPRLVVLPGSDSVTSSSEALASPKMVQLVDEMKSRYPARLVVFDLPPLVLADDVIAFSPYVDAVLLVVQANKTSRESVRSATELLGDTPLIGTVLNRADESMSTHYY